MGRGPSKALMAHVRREIMHAQWDILLDNEFLEAYAHGIVLEGEDKIQRRFYPRIFTYSADYPEKFVAIYLIWSISTYSSVHRVLIAGIRDKGRCPCPRCLMPLDRVHNLGTVPDMRQRQSLARTDNLDRRDKVTRARDMIYKENKAVNNRASEELLKDQSLVATKAGLSLYSLAIRAHFRSERIL